MIATLTTFLRSKTTKGEDEISSNMEAAISSDADISKTPETTTNDDPNNLYQSPSQRLKQIDRKFFMIAGFFFWATLFLAGGAATMTILSRKKTPVEIGNQAPTLAPTPGANEVPSESPSNPNLTPHTEYPTSSWFPSVAPTFTETA